MYVDSPGYRDFHGITMSLMIADSDKELHAMAYWLGLPRAIFSVGRSHYYSITREQRDKAVMRGALLVDRKVILDKLR